MAMGRIDGGKPGPRLDPLPVRTARPRPGAGGEITPSDTISDPEAAGDLDLDAPLDTGGQRARAPRTRLGARGGITPSDTISDPEAAGDLDLDALIDIGRRRAAARRSPQQCIADFAEPRISDPAIFQGSRQLSILERLASDIIPAFDDNEELRALAGDVIADEIDRHRELAARILSGIMS